MKGPYSVQQNSAKVYSQRVWYRTANGQKKRTPLPYASYLFKRNFEKGSPFPPSVAQLTYALLSYGGSHQATCKYQHALNDAYSKFKEKVAAEAANGTNAAEYRQTVQLLAGTLQALRHPTKTMLDLAKKYFSKTKSPGLFGAMSDAWLAWHFGVEPLVKDVYATLELLTKPLPPGRMIFGQGRAQTSYTYTNNGSLYADISVLLRARVGARVEVSNPNVFLASQLGLINPASVAWDLVPFSFVVDWFFDLSSLIASFSDFAGCRIVDAYYTQYGTGASVEYEPKIPPNVRLATYEGFSMVRSVGLYQPFPVPRIPNFGFSRVATASALLNQQFLQFQRRRG